MWQGQHPRRSQEMSLVKEGADSVAVEIPAYRTCQEHGASRTAAVMEWKCPEPRRQAKCVTQWSRTKSKSISGQYQERKNQILLQNIQ